MTLIQDLLRSGQKVILEGISFEYDGEAVELNPGDFYAAERNIGPNLLTVKWVDREIGCVHPEEVAYSYDLRECVKVKPIDL